MPNDPKSLKRDDILLDVKGLKKHFPIRKGVIRRSKGFVKAVDGVDLFVRCLEFLVLVAGDVGIVERIDEVLDVPRGDCHRCDRISGDGCLG